MIWSLFLSVLLAAHENTRVLKSLEETQGAEYWVITPDSWRSTLDPLLQKRAHDGLTVAVAPVELFRDPKKGLESNIQKFFQKGFQSWKEKPRFLLLIGDTGENGIPAFSKDWSQLDFGPDEVDRKSFRQVLSDDPYAQLDDDGSPDIAVGRLPARSAEELRGIVEKILGYEGAGPGSWRKRVLLLAGLFGEPRIDETIQTAVTGLVDQELPYDFDFQVIEASPNFPNNSYYGVGFDRTREFFQRQIQRGSLFTIYAGHGSPAGFACPLPSEKAANSKSNLTKREWMDLFTAADAEQLDCGAKSPIFISFACYTGGFAGKKKTIADSAIRNPNGPVAYIGASGVSNPISDFQLAHNLTQGISATQAPTIGELFLDAKRKVVKPVDDFHKKIGAAAVLFGYNEEIIKNLTQFEIWIYNLHGDPAMSIKKPERRVQLQLPGDTSWQPVKVSGTIEGFGDGDALLTLETPRVLLVDWKKPANESEIESSWAQANNKVVEKIGVEVRRGKFEAEFPVVPGLEKGRYFIKVYARSENADAIGSISLDIKK